MKFQLGFSVNLLCVMLEVGTILNVPQMMGLARACFPDPRFHEDLIGPPGCTGQLKITPSTHIHSQQSVNAFANFDKTRRYGTQCLEPITFRLVEGDYQQNAYQPLRSSALIKGPTACLLEQAKMMFSLLVRSGA